ncbi:phospholipase D-like domain-containing protein [Spirillospora sp. CA-255316]
MAASPAASPERGTEGTEHAEQRIRRRLERLIGIAATEGNEVLPLRNGDQIFPAMLEAIGRAERTIDMMTYVYWRGDIARRFADALGERARAGVRVRLLLDGIGCHPIEKDLVDRMSADGVTVAWFRKPPYLSPFKQNHRCHRKVLVVDENTAFTGGVGIAEEWCGDARDANEWRDTHVRVRGPAVDGVAAGFAQGWAECHDELFDERDRFGGHEPAGDAVVQVVRGSASLGWQDMQTLMRVVLESAEERVRLSTAYFAPDDYFTGLLGRTARRGVDIEILLPGPRIDKRVSLLGGQQHYERLLADGVRVWQFQPTMLHTKVLTIDGTVSLVGSTNFNRRSMDHDEEIMLAVVDRDFTAALDGHFDDDLRRSEEIREWRWKRRSRLQRAAELSVVPIRRFL